MTPFGQILNGVESPVVDNHFCHVKSIKVWRPGTFWAAQKDVLYLERGPGRYVLAWSVSRAFSTIDREETLHKNAQMSDTRSCEWFHIQVHKQPWLLSALYLYQMYGPVIITGSKLLPHMHTIRLHLIHNRYQLPASHVYTSKWCLPTRGPS